MIEAVEALKLVLSETRDPGVEEVSLPEATGRVLRQVLQADRGFPPFDRVMMDGIAISYSALQEGHGRFIVEQVQAAGRPKCELVDERGCIEVMTGAVRPTGTDVVIPYEEIEISGGLAIFTGDPTGYRRWKNIHREATDVRPGEVLVQPGKILGPAEIGVAASIGRSKIVVTKRPRVAVVSSGDELVEVSDEPLPHQIRKSNAYSLASALRQYQIVADFFHLQDEKAAMSALLERLFADYDVLLLTGGVSKGKYDHVPGVLASLGVKQAFHGVRQKPGKPFWFGVTDRVVVFAFPGNPVSTMVCFCKYFRPWLGRSMRWEGAFEQAGVLREDCENHTGKTLFVPVKAGVGSSGQIEVTPYRGRGSGDHANLVHCNAFMELASERILAAQGDSVSLIFFDGHLGGL